MLQAKSTLTVIGTVMKTEKKADLMNLKFKAHV